MYVNCLRHSLYSSSLIPSQSKTQVAELGTLLIFHQTLPTLLGLKTSTKPQKNSETEKNMMHQKLISN